MNISSLILPVEKTMTGMIVSVVTMIVYGFIIYESKKWGNEFYVRKLIKVLIPGIIWFDLVCGELFKTFGKGLTYALIIGATITMIDAISEKNNK